MKPGQVRRTARYRYLPSFLIPMLMFPQFPEQFTEKKFSKSAFLQCDFKECHELFHNSARSATKIPNFAALFSIRLTTEKPNEYVMNDKCFSLTSLNLRSSFWLSSQKSSRWPVSLMIQSVCWAHTRARLQYTFSLSCKLLCLGTFLLTFGWKSWRKLWR